MTRRQCRRCETDLPADAYRTRKYCVTCSVVAAQESRRRYREAFLLRPKEAKQLDPFEILERRQVKAEKGREWHRKNHQHSLEYKRAYRRANRAKLAAYMREYTARKRVERQLAWPSPSRVA